MVEEKCEKLNILTLFKFYIPTYFSSVSYRRCEADFLLIQWATHPLTFSSDEWVLLLVTGHPWWQKREGVWGWSCFCINEPVDQKRPLDWQWQGSLIRPAENKTQLSPPVLFKQDVDTDFFSLPQILTPVCFIRLQDPTMIWTVALLMILTTCADSGEGPAFLLYFKKHIYDII